MLDLKYSRLISKQFDIDDQQKSDEALRYQALLMNNVSDAVISTDLNFKIVSWNRAAETIYGWKQEEVIGKTVTEVTHTEFHTGERRKFIQNLQKNGGWEGKVIERTRDGLPLDISASISVIRNGSSKPVGVVAINRNITESKQAREALLQSEEQFRNIFENGPLSMGLSYADYHYFKVNAAFCQMLGYSEEEMLKLTFRDITHPEYIKNDCESVHKLFKGDLSIYQVEKLYLRKDGTAIWGKTTVTAIRDRQGNFQCFLALVENIHERKLAEIALQENKRKFKELVELLPEVVFEADTKGNLTFVNKPAFKLFGYHNIQKERINLLNYLAPLDRSRAIGNIQKKLAGDYVGTNEYTAVNSNGKEFPVLVSSNIVKNNLGEVVGIRGILVDITDRKAAEEQIKLNEARLESIFRINQFSEESIQKLWNFALKEAIELTHSKIGCINFYNEDREEFSLNSWYEKTHEAYSFSCPPKP
jgi:PAS domain S-box-containing protein